MNKYYFTWTKKAFDVTLRFISRGPLYMVLESHGVYTRCNFSLVAPLWPLDSLWLFLGIILLRCTDRKSVSNPPSWIFQVEIYNKQLEKHQVSWQLQAVMHIPLVREGHLDHRDNSKNLKPPKSYPYIIFNPKFHYQSKYCMSKKSWHILKSK